MIETLRRLKRALTETDVERLRRTHPQPESSWPRILQFEVTGICNLRCTMCPTTYFPTNKSIDQETLEACYLGVPHAEAIIPFLGGEPYVYKRFPEVLDRIRSLNKTAYLGFNTNATLLDEEKAEQLCSLPATEVIFSVDGAKAETYNAIRIRADFDDVISKIRMVVRVRGAREFPRLGILLTAHKNNYREIPDLVRLAADIGLNRVMINGMEPYTEELRDLVCYSSTPDPEIERVFAEGEELARQLGLEIQRPSLLSTREQKFCPSLSQIFIRADGEVFPCSYFSTDDPFWYHGEARRHMGPMSFGNVKETPLHEIWNSDRYIAFRDALRTGKFHKECKQCLLSEGVTCNAQIFPL